ncbi:sensor histidine kinase [Paenibacillus sp. HW567]|uniref:sensor histidine kinase n=1 Tax=Paenibacillus sp. HW567 TaxID=1034769 RepID=UPI000A004EEA|nr:sensor histidine kinase [Paenibacillus sp. HW567]
MKYTSVGYCREEVQAIALFPVRRSMPLRQKIQISNILIVSLALVFFIISIYRIVFNQTLERTTASSQQEVNLVKKSLATMFLSVQNFSKFALINQDTQHVLSENTGAGSDVSALKSIHNTLAAMLETEPNIDSVIIESGSGELYYTSNLTGVSLQSLDVYPREKIDSARGGAVWVDTFRPSFYSGMKRKNMIGLGRVIMSMEKGTPLGYIYVNMDERTLARLYQNGQGAQNPTMVINGDGLIVSASDQSLVSRSVRGYSFSQWVRAGDEGSRIFDVAGVTYLVSFQSLEPYGWKVVHLVPTSALTYGYWKIALLMIVFGLISMVTAVGLSIVFSRLLTRPLKRLSEAIVEVGAGNLNMRAPAETDDEIGRLGATFNEMVDHIQGLVLRVEEDAKTKRLLELRLLYSQIKPHFLYNTLDTIRSMAVMANAKEISNILRALGEFFRSSLNNGQELIAVAQEKKHLQSYLYIQQIRFKKLKYHIEFEPEIEACRVPTMLLQPLVENAIHHGIREMPDGGLCEIFGYAEGEGEQGNLIFIVRDNGKGMDEEQQQRIWSNEGEGELYSFGLKNIQDRIQLRFGGSYGIELSSEPGKGVEVLLRLPLILNTDDPEEVDE